jgi:hypothetical protein
MHMKSWIAALDGTTVIALQHCCGVSDAPVNCYTDEHCNWVCPNCLTTYGAATPIGTSAQQSVATLHPDEE